MQRQCSSSLLYEVAAPPGQGREVGAALFYGNLLSSWVWPLCEAVAPASVKVQLFARDSESITLVVKNGSYGILARAALLRGTELPAR